MSLDLILLAVVGLSGIVGSVLVVTRDGYRRIPTRRP